MTSQLKRQGKRHTRAHGEVRQSQMLTTYGPGALVDLPRHAVIIGGLEGWSDVGRQPIIEERLVEKLRKHFDGKEMGLFTPPADDATTAAAGVPSGVTVWQFPRWFVAQYEELRSDGSRARPLILQNDLVDGGFRNAARKKPWPVVPIRFVQACINGHIDDINWRYFVHGKGDACRRQMWIDERGTSGDFTEIFIRCECNKARSLASAKSEGSPLGMCNGRRPWIAPNDYEKCEQPNRLLVRHASNAYFSQVLSVIHIPDASAALKKAVDDVWVDYLQYADSADDVKKERKKQKVFVALEEHDDDKVFAEVLRRKGQKPVEDKSVKQVEVETLMAQTEHLVDDLPDADFYASALPKPTARSPSASAVMAKVEKVVLVHRLREVKAQLGFTRFEGGTTTEEGELDLPVGLAHLAAEPSWLPAIENRGEGVFVAFKPAEIQKWLDRKQVDARALALSGGLNAWAKSKGRPPKPYSPVYAMLHSLSHLLLVAVSLECGYPSSAIRERVYATKAGLGILLYTGTSDAEGTLGGLVNVGRHIEHHLKTALDLGRLCSNDPVCAQHRPDNQEERRFLHGAACHGCLLISEHSCEMKNEYLDRALVVPTVAGLGCAFFGTP